MAEYSGIEKRKFPRVKIGLHVVFRKNEGPNVRIRDNKGENEAAMLDIGQGGIAIRTAVDMAAGTEIYIKFTLFESVGMKGVFYGDFELLGRVCSSILVDKDSYRLGIAFLEVSDKIKESIANFIRIVESSEPPQQPG